MVERLPYLALLLITVAFMTYGFLARRKRSKPRDRTFASKLMWVSVGLATALVGSSFPAIWAFVSFVVHGGRIEDNLPPGYSPQVILAALLISAAFTAISAAYGYIEHLDA